MLRHPWIQEVHALYMFCDGKPGLAGADLAQVCWEALEVVHDAQAWRTEQELDRAKRRTTGSRIEGVNE